VQQLGHVRPEAILCRLTVQITILLVQEADLPLDDGAGSTGRRNTI
jgi:hypothetical protein